MGSSRDLRLLDDDSHDDDETMIQFQKVTKNQKDLDAGMRWDVAGTSEVIWECDLGNSSEDEDL